MIEVRTGTELMVIRNVYDDRERLKGIGATWRPSLGGWTLPASPRCATQLAIALVSLAFDADEGFARLLVEGESIAAANSLKSKGGLAPIPGSTDAWLHQRQAYWFGMEAKLDGMMLAMGMGTGKSRTVIGFAEGYNANSMYVLGPKRALKVWNREFPQHAEREWNVINPPLTSSVPKRAQYVQREIVLSKTRKQPYVVCLNHEAFWRPGMFNILKAGKWDVGYVDESHRIKAPGGKASKGAATLRPYTHKRLCGSGTPMGHSPLDIYGQYRFLDTSVFGTSFNRFKNRYAVEKKMGDFTKVVGYQNEEELAERFGSIAYICGEEVLDLPEALDVPRPFELSAATRRAYHLLDSGIAVQVKGGQITVANALTKLLRLQQITSGFIKDDEGIEQQLGNDKIEVLRETLEDIDVRNEPTVIFCRFTNDIRRVAELCDEMGLAWGELSGRADTVLTDEATMRDDIAVAIVQEQAGGSGVDLTRAAIVIYYSINFSLTDYDQSRKRVHRPGQTRPVRYIHLIAEGTKDEVVYEALDNRRNIIDAVLEAARRQ